MVYGFKTIVHMQTKKLFTLLNVHGMHEIIIGGNIGNWKVRKSKKGGGWDHNVLMCQCIQVVV